MTTAVRVRELVEQQVRASIRNDGLDPLTHHGTLQLTPVVLTDREVRYLVERMLRVLGRRLDASSQFLLQCILTAAGRKRSFA